MASDFAFDVQLYSIHSHANLRANVAVICCCAHISDAAGDDCVELSVADDGSVPRKYTPSILMSDGDVSIFVMQSTMPLQLNTRRATIRDTLAT